MIIFLITLFLALFHEGNDLSSSSDNERQGVGQLSSAVTTIDARAFLIDAGINEDLDTDTDSEMNWISQEWNEPKPFLIKKEIHESYNIIGRSAHLKTYFLMDLPPPLFG